MNDFNGPYNEILPGQTGVEAAQGRGPRHSQA